MSGLDNVGSAQNGKPNLFLLFLKVQNIRLNSFLDAASGTRYPLSARNDVGGRQLD